MKANVYVDGFNLYYGAVKDTPYRWLNIAATCRLLLPRLIRVRSANLRNRSREPRSKTDRLPR